MKWFLAAAFLVTLIRVGFIHPSKPLQKNMPTSNHKSFALLELFTSEGCSSCPSAERLLPQLIASDSNIIALSFHVDYWNYLGWKDRFSSSEFTNRQREYGSQFRLESIYTPQLVINGQYELVGSNRPTAESDIKEALKQKPELQLSFGEVKREGDKLKITTKVEGESKNQSVFVALVEKHAESDVKAGENRGTTLSHINVVRSFLKKAAQPELDFEFSFPKDLAEDNWQLVLFSQHKNDLKITGVAKYNP